MPKKVILVFWCVVACAAVIVSAKGNTKNGQTVEEGLPQKQVDRQKREDEEAKQAEGNPDLGKRFRARTELERYAYSVLSQVEENGDKLSDEEKAMANGAAEEVIRWIQTNLHAPVAEYQSRRRQLEEQVSHLLSQFEEVIDFDKDEL